MDAQNNLDLWNRVKETDPKYAKRVDLRGGFTAIDPQYQLEKATAEWGPYGTKWKLKNLNYYLDKQEIPSLCLVAIFTYPGGEFPIGVDMRWKPGDDCYKKLMTSARSKALSMLGFDSLIFMGAFDDNHYVAELRAKYSDQDELRAKILTAIREAGTKKQVEAARERAAKLFSNGAINKILRDEAFQCCDEQSRELLET